MRSLNFFQRFFVLWLLASPLFAASVHPLESNADKTITKLYQDLQKTPAITERIVKISGFFLGKPYLLGALGEGMRGQFDQSPLYRVDVFDCETYVDTVLALAFANNLSQFRNYINQIRYKQGEVSFIKRNHFTCIDWNRNNQKQGFLKDITPKFHNENNQPVCKYAGAWINKAAWYQHFSEKAIKRVHADPSEAQQRLIALKKEGEALPKQWSVIPYLPFSVLFDSNGKPNLYLFQQIPNGSIVEIIRPNWDLTAAIGTHLNISHLGFAIWHNKQLLFREASTIQQKVIDVPLIDYLREQQKNPTIKGINVQVVIFAK